MESKNKKTRVKKVVNIIPENDNTNALMEKNESIFIQGFEMQENSLDLSDSSQENVTANKRKLFLNYIPWILLVIFLPSSFYFWSQLSDIKKDPLKAAKAETLEIINTVGKIMVLPKGEYPKIATLTEDDLGKIKTQSFFINASAGDKVLVYSIARKVVLYNPTSNKIVEVANLDSDNSTVLEPSM